MILKYYDRYSTAIINFLEGSGQQVWKPIASVEIDRDTLCISQLWKESFLSVLVQQSKAYFQPDETNRMAVKIGANLSNQWRAPAPPRLPGRLPRLLRQLFRMEPQFRNNSAPAVIHLLPHLMR